MMMADIEYTLYREVSLVHVRRCIEHIASGFGWVDTQEGHDYWLGVIIRLQTIYKDNNGGKHHKYGSWTRVHPSAAGAARALFSAFDWVEHDFVLWDGIHHKLARIQRTGH